MTELTDPLFSGLTAAQTAVAAANRDETTQQTETLE